MLKTRGLAVFGLLLALVPSAGADDNGVRQEAMDRAHNFLRSASRGRFVNNFVHFGTKYAQHDFKAWGPVADGNGKLVRGEFYLDYSFDWDRDGATDVRFFCDRRGNIKSITVVNTNAILAQPYLAANAGIKILGNLVIEALTDKLSDADRKDLQKAVDDADAENLLLKALQLQQGLGQ
jgi:hypothetical protein